MDLLSIQKKIEEEIGQLQFGDKPAELYQPLSYIMAMGGKRLRPCLAVFAYHLYQNDWQQAIRPSLALEVFHNFTLLHDDLMDQAPSRRGMPTVHQRWNANIAILSGDVMLVKAYELLFDVPQSMLKPVLSQFSKMAAEVCEGQQLDMNFEQLQSVSKPEYIAMIRLKTSVLLGFALQLGGILAGVDETEQQKLYNIGIQAGLGFQIMDDILDVYGDPAKFGKQIGGDILANKKTWLLIDALENTNELQKKELEYWLMAEKPNAEQKVNAVTEIYNAAGVKQRAMMLANSYFANALKELGLLEAEMDKKMALSQFFEQLMNRDK